MKSVTYHAIQSSTQNVSGFQMHVSGVPKGEFWPLLRNGSYAAVIQADETVLCMSVVEKENYYSPEQQLKNIVDGYLSDPNSNIKRVIAQGKVRYFRRHCMVIVSVGDVELLSLNTMPFQTACTFTDYSEGNAYQYFVDFLHPHLFDPLLKQGKYAALITAIQPLRIALGKPIVE